MNVNRKIQLAAIAVIANGALALSLLSSGPAFAASCGPKFIGCIPVTNCQYAQPFCTQLAPPGCVVTGESCTPCIPGYLNVTCYYRAG